MVAVDQRLSLFMGILAGMLLGLLEFWTGGKFTV